MEVSVGLLDHYNVSTRRLKETVRFYEDVLGFVNGPRPQFDFPGLGSIAQAIRCCTLTTSPGPTNSSTRT